MEIRGIGLKKAKSFFLAIYSEIRKQEEAVNIAPLVSFRIIFGLVMVISVVRFWALGWIEDHFVETQVTFKYFGFYWVQLLPPFWMYVLHLLMFLGAVGITLGFLYKFSAWLHFLTFTYVELIDLTYYLNHYYFVSIISFLLLFVPANRRLSVDCLLWPHLFSKVAPRWTINIFKVQIAIVYIYAGLAKINYDWLIQAMPLRIWLPAQDSLPVIGSWLKLKAMPYVFSWLGMLYDTTIVIWLSWHRTWWLGYTSVIAFHTITGMMFQIGIFPLVMIGATWIYFSPNFHEKLVRSLEKLFARLPGSKSEIKAPPTWYKTILIIHFIFQIAFPWRYLLYPGNLFWSEEGYRFSWRVMLMEKAGTATFFVKDAKTGREGVVDNQEFLNPHQEKQMAMQPDLILQYAHFLEDYYQKKGVHAPEVRAEVYVTLNAKPSKLLIDPNQDLTKISDSWSPKNWIIHYETY